jgi:hypothetical protein
MNVDLFSISTGFDLQLDEEEKEKETLFLGVLIHTVVLGKVVRFFY